MLLRIYEILAKPFFVYWIMVVASTDYSCSLKLKKYLLRSFTEKSSLSSDSRLGLGFFYVHLALGFPLRAVNPILQHSV